MFFCELNEIYIESERRIVFAGGTKPHTNTEHHEYFIINNQKSMLSSNNKSRPSTIFLPFTENTNEKKKKIKFGREKRHSREKNTHKRKKFTRNLLNFFTQHKKRERGNVKVKKHLNNSRKSICCSFFPLLCSEIKTFSLRIIFHYFIHCYLFHLEKYETTLHKPEKQINEKFKFVLHGKNGMENREWGCWRVY